MSEQKGKDIFKDQPKGSSQKNSKSDKLTNDKPISKQSSYYTKNKKSINRKRRLRYKQTQDKKGKNKRKNLKPNDIKSDFFNTEINNLNRLYNSLNNINNGIETENKVILCFNDLINFASSKLEKERKGLLHTAPKTTRFFVLPEIVGYVGNYREASFDDLEHFVKGDFVKGKLSTRQLRRAIESTS